jgi:hypothetical protein
MTLMLNMKAKMYWQLGAATQSEREAELHQEVKHDTSRTTLILQLTSVPNFALAERSRVLQVVQKR